MASMIDSERLRGKAAASQGTGAGVRTEIADVKTDVANLHTAIIKWLVGTMIAGVVASYSLSRLFG